MQRASPFQMRHRFARAKGGGPLMAKSTPVPSKPSMSMRIRRKKTRSSVVNNH